MAFQGTKGKKQKRKQENGAAIEIVGGVGGRYYCSPPFLGSIEILKLLGGETGGETEASRAWD